MNTHENAYDMYIGRDFAEWIGFFFVINLSAFCIWLYV